MNNNVVTRNIYYRLDRKFRMMAAYTYVHVATAYWYIYYFPVQYFIGFVKQFLAYTIL